MGQIYCIRNKINGKCYVGQTVNTFRQRYRSGSWFNGVTSTYLKRSLQANGPESFEVFIIHDNPEYTIDDLNKLEEMWAEKLNSYMPHGYNLRKCGYNQTPVDAVRYAQAKTVYCSNGKTYRSLVECGKDIGVSTSSVCMAMDTEKRVAGYLVSLGPVSKSKSFLTKKTIAICCSNGKTYKSINSAARELGLNGESVRKAVHGKQLVAGGYRFWRVGSEPSTRESKNKKKTLRRSDGKLYKSVSEAAIDLTGSKDSPFRAQIRHCCNGKRKTYYGFRFKWIGE